MNKFIEAIGRKSKAITSYITNGFFYLVLIMIPFSFVVLSDITSDLVRKLISKNRSKDYINGSMFIFKCLIVIFQVLIFMFICWKIK